MSGNIRPSKLGIDTLQDFSVPRRPQFLNLGSKQFTLPLTLKPNFHKHEIRSSFLFGTKWVHGDIGPSRSSQRHKKVKSHRNRVFSTGSGQVRTSQIYRLNVCYDIVASSIKTCLLYPLKKLLKTQPKQSDVQFFVQLLMIA